jgi:iron complex transport system ATP-binding protein
MAEASGATLESVSFAYEPGRQIIRSLNLDVRRGHVLALLGQNGCGKTTLLKLIAGALHPGAGRVTVTKRIGFVPQLTQVSFAYSALDMVLMGRVSQIHLFATPSHADESAAVAALERVGMLPLAHRSFDTLSGGERQLVLFARALASDAQLLVLDEPTAALDLAHQRLVLERIHRLSRDDGLTIVFSTHQPDHAAAVAEDVALMFRDGTVVSGPLQETMTTERLSQLFGIEVRRATVAGGGQTVSFVPVWNLGP